MTTATWVERLVVRTVELPAHDPRAASSLTDLLPAAHSYAWLRGGEGLIGWGEAARLSISGPQRLSLIHI